MTRPEVRRPVSPMEQWFWIADQLSPLNVIARVRLVGHVGIWTISGCDIPARIGAWQLSGAQFVSGVLPFGYLVATVNTSQGELFWNFTYPEGAVSQRTATGFADGCLQNLLRAIA